MKCQCWGISPGSALFAKIKTIFRDRNTSFSELSLIAELQSCAPIISLIELKLVWRLWDYMEMNCYSHYTTVAPNYLMFISMLLLSAYCLFDLLIHVDSY